MVNRDDLQASYFCALIYVESDDYDTSSVLGALTDFDEWAYALHDSDVAEDGHIKKPHYHLVFRNLTSAGVGSPSTVGAVAKKLGLDSRFIQPGIRSLDSDGNPVSGRFKGAVKYLIHGNKEDKLKGKYQYDRSIIVSNLNLDLFFGESFDMAKKIMNYILTERPRSFTQLCNWCINNDCWKEFRRSQYAFVTVMKEVKCHEV